VLAASAGIAAFVVSQYAVLAVMLRLARGVRVLDTVRVDCVLIDAGLVSLGAVAAALWEINQGLVALTLLPFALAYRSLAIPGLVEATRIEPKTGLYNMRHFQNVLSQELQRAGRFDRPLSVLMIDVDHLREINTTRGHVAGDRALKSVAIALQSATVSTTSRRASGATSSASSSPRPTSKAPSSWPSASEASSRARPPIGR